MPLRLEIVSAVSPSTVGDSPRSLVSPAIWFAHGGLECVRASLLVSRCSPVPHADSIALCVPANPLPQDTDLGESLTSGRHPGTDPDDQYP